MFENRKIDYDLLAKELIKALRGKRSQMALSHRLKFTYNQVGKWEAGHTKIHWVEFVKLCETCKISLAQQMVRYYKFSGEPSDISAVIKKFIEPLSASEAARKMKVSRHSLASWIKSAASPTLSDVFKILLLYRGGEGHLISFVGSLVGDIYSLPSIANEFVQRERQIRAGYNYPWLGSVGDCLELKEYKDLSAHETGFLMRRLRITHEEERMALDFLSEVGVIKFLNGKFVSTGRKLAYQENILSHSLDREGNFRIREYWWGQALRHLNERPDWAKLLYAFQTLAVSEKAFAKIRLASIKYFNDILTIVDEDDESKSVFRVMTFCFFDPSQTAGPKDSV